MGTTPIERQTFKSRIFCPTQTRDSPSDFQAARPGPDLWQPRGLDRYPRMPGLNPVPLRACLYVLCHLAYGIGCRLRCFAYRPMDSVRSVAHIEQRVS